MNFKRDTQCEVQGLTLIIPGYFQNKLSQGGGGAQSSSLLKSAVLAILLHTKQQKTFQGTLGTQELTPIGSFNEPYRTPNVDIMIFSCGATQYTTLCVCLCVLRFFCLNDQAHIAWFTSGVARGQKMTFEGRRPLTEDDFWRKTTFDGRHLWRNTTTWKNVYDSSPWQPQHNWPQTGNPISCLNRK